MYSTVKNVLKSKLSDRQRSSLRLLYRTARDPKNIRRHLNTFRYDNDVLHAPEIDFVPPIFAAKVTDSCNLKCPSCLYILKDRGTFSPSFISTVAFRDVLEKYNNENRAEVIFLTGGEPLLHPKIDELIDISKEYSAGIKMSTNGILVKSNIPSLLKLDYVNVSVDSYDYESFMKYRGGTPKQFDMITDGLKTLKEKGAYFSVSFLLYEENLPNIGKMIQFAEDVKPNFVYFHNVNPHGSSEYRPLTLQNRETRDFLGKIRERCDYPFDIIVSRIFDTDSPTFIKSKCIQPWYYFCFNSKGEISFCCHLRPDGDIGNAFADYDYNSSKMVKFRDDIIEGKIMQSCLYCQRRFMGEEFYKFDSKKKNWFMQRHGN